MEHVAVGAIALAFGVAGLFFLRFWRDTRERLFALFALAFFVLAVNRVGLAVLTPNGERGDHLYWVRFCAFALILVAIVDKNRGRKPPAQAG
ncbi:MAG TPA: DUF5985 family protein [Gemmataceae bacterium]|jgi:hypothetical protein